MNKKGFTLVEVFIVIAIVGILGSIAIGGIMSIMTTAKVTHNGEVVFEGMGMCVDTSSAGANTKVRIGLPCRLRPKYIVDKDIQVEIQ